MRNLIKKLIKESFNELLLESKIQDPTKREMLSHLRIAFGPEIASEYRDDAEIAMYWFANFNHGGQSSNLYSVLSNSYYSPGRLARGPESEGDFVKILYDELENKFGSGLPNNETDEETDETDEENIRFENTDTESVKKRYKSSIYNTLEKNGFRLIGNPPKEYVEFYLYGYATVSCMIDILQKEIIVERYYDSEYLNTNKQFTKKYKLPEEYSTDFENKIVSLCLKLKKSIENSSSLESDIDN
jgi:hypothetical protein